MQVYIKNRIIFKKTFKNIYLYKENIGNGEKSIYIYIYIYIYI